MSGVNRRISISEAEENYTYPPLVPLSPDCKRFRSGIAGLEQLLTRNREWAESKLQLDPTYFTSLTSQQKPRILWIGCSDSRVPANEILSLPPGEVFVHSNIANVVVSTDLNCLSVLEFAVTVLKVKHVIVCGHYGCGGVRSALMQQEFGLLDNWIRAIKDVYTEHKEKFGEMHEPAVRGDLLTELNVAKSVYNVCHTRIVQSAWKSGQNLSVHGWCYRLHDGIIRDLNLCVSNAEQVEPIYRSMISKQQPEK